MPLDREKAFANAERLLKQGKTAQALEECQKLSEDAPKDLLMLNRIGDLLSRSDRGAEAIVYYDKIADQFSASGFYPKAIAILKKVIKVAPTRLETLVRLGELSLKQKHSGEARTWFLQAAEAYLRAREFAKAREVYEKLVAAEPENFVHAVRLAEARAAEGHAEKAGQDLLTLATRMLAAARLEDAERTFKRAAELMPGRAEPAVGLARCHAAAGRTDAALKIVDEVWPQRPGAEHVAGDLLMLLDQVGDNARVARLLADPKGAAISDEAIEHVMRASVSRGDVEGAWSRLGPALDRSIRAHEFPRALNLLERLTRIEEGGHLRAIEQIVEVRKAEGNKPATARAIERLVRACQAKGLNDRLDTLLETLRLFDPAAPLLFVGRPSPAPAERPAESPARPAASPVPASPKASPPADAAVPVAFEAPAVPLGPADEEFVSGHLTEAEVFEKYGLHQEAVQQLRHVVERFPGHVTAIDKLVGLLRTQADRGSLRDALVAGAFAKRAAGDLEAARRAAAEAASIGGIEGGPRSALERLALLTGAAAAPAPAPAPKAAAAPPKAAPAPKAAPRAAASSAPAAPAAPPPKAASPAAPAAPPPQAGSRAAPGPAARAASPPPAPSRTTRQDEEDLEILFDDDEGAAPAAAATAADREVVEEIEFYIAQGMNADALRRIAEVRRAAGPSDELDRLEARARATTAGVTPGAGGDEVVVGDEALSTSDADRLDEDDLSSIAAALDAEYGTPRAETTVRTSDPDAEQSVDEVFAAFKEHVRAEVDGGDFRTHYDLGIAYKEMGLVDDAIAEFRVATSAPELFREACSMLGLCHWERGDAGEAIRWYRAALEAPGEEEAPLSGLRYDLAEILLQTGDDRGALDLYAQVAAQEPEYREVGRRLAELRSRLAP